MRPRLLDLCCGAGLAAIGYHRAGFDVFGVDLDPAQLAQYPYPCVRADMFALPFDLASFDVIHASPPCQAYSTMGNRARWPAPDLIVATLDLLRASGRPWVLENVVGARHLLPDAVQLSGAMFGLGVHRPRLFASNQMILVPPRARPPIGGVGVYGRTHDGRRLWNRAAPHDTYRAPASLAEAHTAMGADHADWHGTKEGVPPAYTEHIGRQLIGAT